MQHTILEFQLKSKDGYVPKHELSLSVIWKLFKYAIKLKINNLYTSSNRNLMIWAIKGDNNDYSIYVEK